MGLCAEKGGKGKKTREVMLVYAGGDEGWISQPVLRSNKSWICGSKLLSVLSDVSFHSNCTTGLLNHNLMRRLKRHE